MCQQVRLLNYYIYTLNATMILYKQRLNNLENKSVSVLIN